MPNASEPKPTARDRWLLQALYLSPLTTTQILSFCRHWPAPFSHFKTLNRRLQKLCSPGTDWISRHTYARTTVSTGPSYYRVAERGYELLTGDAFALPPGNYSFGEIPFGLEKHSFGLAQIIVRMIGSAPECGLLVTDCRPDGAVVLDSGERGRALIPDFTCCVACGTGRRFHYCFEFDRGTRRQRSVTAHKESLAWMIKRYEARHYAVEAAGLGFVVPFVTSVGPRRVRQFMETVRSTVIEPRRKLFLATTLDLLLRVQNPFRESIFLAQDGSLVPLLPEYHCSDYRPAAYQPDLIADPTRLR
jgi:hypothetical protein